MAVHPQHRFIYLAESDHRVLSPEETQKRLSEMVSCITLSRPTESSLFQKDKQGKKAHKGVLDLPPEIFGRPKAEAGKWASCISVLDPVNVSPNAR